MKLNVKAYAFTCALFAGFMILWLTGWMLLGWEHAVLAELWAWAYPGYSVTPVGALIGFAYTFGEFLILGALFAWLYNFFASRGSAGKE